MTDSREALLGLLSSLAEGDVSPERLAAAREGIREGRLDAAEATLPDRAGRPIPLLAWAARWNDLEMVELLLERGAHVDAGHGAGGTALHEAVCRGDAALAERLLARGASPLALRADGESVLRAAHAHGVASALFQSVRRAAREASAQAPHTGLGTLPHERRYALWNDRGVDDLRRAVQARQKLDVLLVDADMKAVARALGNLVSSPRREADVAYRPVQDAKRLLFLYRLRGIGWTIVPLVFDNASPWNVEHVMELAAPGAGIAPLARALSCSVERRVIHVEHDAYTIHTEFGGIERRPSDAMSEELSELGVFVPPMRVGTDGYHARLELFGLDASDVERVDVVVLQELGEPEVDRRVELPTAAPPLVGTSAARMPGAPALVQPPEPAAKSEAPPLVREPPPLVVETGPAPSDAPPLVREPPPLVARASEPPTAPPVVPLAPPARSAEPPLVREPPPLVVDAGGDEIEDP